MVVSLDAEALSSLRYLRTLQDSLFVGTNVLTNARPPESQVLFVLAWPVLSRGVSVIPRAFQCHVLCGPGLLYSQSYRHLVRTAPSPNMLILL